jgi:hypothetical protein
MGNTPLTVIRRRFVLIAIVLGLGLGIGVFDAVGAQAATPLRAPTTTTTPVPSAWNPMIAPIAAAVTRLRGLAFKRPVAVRFLGDAAFDGLLRSEYASLTRVEREQRRNQLEDLRALGLVAGTTDLSQVLATPETSSILAFYDPATRQITVRGNSMDPAHRLTVAHELTHALDDQWFHLEKMQGNVRSSASAGRTDLIEGDAERVENLYELGLTGAERTQLANARASASVSEPGQSSPDTPEILAALQEAPYILGPTMVDTIVGTRRQRGLDATFRSPPQSDEAAFNPLFAARPHTRVPVKTPGLLAGERKVGTTDDLGPFAVYLILASRIDPVQALHAADGWGGDSVVSFTRNGARCLRAAIAGHTIADTQRLARAFHDFATAVPAASVSVEDTRSTVVVTACDPGTRATVPGAYASRALNQVALRNEVAASALSSGTSFVTAHCAADEITDDPLFRALVGSTATPTDSERQAVSARFATILRACLAAGT